MTEHEKRANVIEGLEMSYTYSNVDDGNTLVPQQLVLDIIALLKAQEPVEPTIDGDADGPCGNWWYQCGKCKEAIDYHDRYCRNCGQAVKWE